MVRNSGTESLFLPGSVYGVDLDWLVDTGCSVTLLSMRSYKNIPGHQRPKLNPFNSKLTQAGGTPLQVLGTADMSIKVGRQKIKHSVVVADCLDQGILGLDFLTQHGARIDLCNSSISISGVEVPFVRQKQLSCSRVSIAETVTVKAGHRMIVEGKVRQNVPSGNWLVEPLPKPLSNDTIAVAKTLTSGGSSTVMMEVMNPTETDAVLYKDTQAATLSSVQVVPEMRPISQSKRKKSKCACVKTNQATLDPELEKLYQDIEHPLSPEEQKSVKELLWNHREVFKTKNGPLGRTDLVKHEIVTTTQQPIKQRARRFPISQREEGQKLVEDMLEQGVIEPSTSPWASPVVLVKKKSGETRFCVDYRKLKTISALSLWSEVSGSN